MYISSIYNSNGNRRGHKILFTEQLLVEHKFGGGWGGGDWSIVISFPFTIFLQLWKADPIKLIIIFKAKLVENSSE